MFLQPRRGENQVERVGLHQGLHQVSRSRLPEQESRQAGRSEGETGGAVSGTTQTPDRVDAAVIQ